MNINDIYCKSELGVNELQNRKMKLSPRLRTMLILVDGRVPVFVLQEEAKKVGASEDFLDQLNSMGLISKVGSIEEKNFEANSFEKPIEADEFTRFRLAKDFMNISAVNCLGIKSFFFTLKLERIENIAELRLLVESFKNAIAKSNGSAEAEVLAQRVMNMLE